MAFCDLAFKLHKPTEAVRKYIGRPCIEHNANIGGGPEGFYQYFEAFFKKNPKAKVIISQVLADGDLVALHLHFMNDDNDPGSAGVDIVRVDNGKLVEHWDAVQPVLAKTASGNSMF